jgi:biopolymer transport protein ExbB
MSFFAKALHEGGPFLFVIIAFGLLTAGFITERYRALYLKFRPVPDIFVNQIREMIRNLQFTQAGKISHDTNSALGRIVTAACQLRARGASDEEVQARMDEALTSEIDKIDKRTGFLAMFGNVATLLGLLGTIIGMIHSFGAVAEASPIDRATLLSKGISEAMNCTAFGLLVAVPALVAYSIFQNKTDHLVKELTQKTSQIYHDLLFSFDVGQKAATAKTENLEATWQ